MINLIAPVTQSLPTSFLGGSPAVADSQNAGGDLAALSPEALEAEGDMPEFLQALLEMLGGQQQQQSPIEKLQQEIERVQNELQQARRSGDEDSAGALSQELDGLMQQLSQLLGQSGQSSPAAAPSGSGAAPVAAAPSSGGGYAPSSGGGGGAPASGGGAAPASGGGAPAPASGGESGGASEVNALPPDLAGDDKKLAEFIEGKLAGTPAEGKGLGAHFVAAGREHDVDPLVLASIGKHETNFGSLGVGLDKFMGVGAFDSDPSAPRQWDGALQQIYSGAETFANLRSKGGSNADAPIGEQLSAVNRAGWATDTSWHTKVAGHYNELSQGSRSRG